MTEKDKSLYIIAGCNGAGETTASFTILPEIIECREFVNADEIARGLSPFQPEKVAITMKKDSKHAALREKIIFDLEKTHEKLIEFKKQKKTPLVVMRDGKIIHVMPE